MEHTPTPWKVEPEQKAFGISIVDKNGNFICQMSNNPSKRNKTKVDAQDIVRAVNSHDELVEALERLLRVAGEGSGLNKSRPDVCEQARKAIAKAEGKN